MHKSIYRKSRHMDLTIFFLTLSLVVFGIVMVFSASFPQAKFKNYGTAHFLNRSAAYAVAGFLVLLVVSRIPYPSYKKITVPLLLLNIGLLTLTVFSPLGKNIEGATRWLNLGFTQLMPSEFTKFSCILTTAHILSAHRRDLSKIQAFLQPVLLVLISVGLIMLQPDFSTSVTIIGTLVIMLFVSGVPMRYLNVLLAGGSAALAGLAMSADYRKIRLISFLDPFKYPENEGWQVIQSLYAMGSGGLLGLGLGRSRQKYGALPLPYNDYIFAVVGEELGYVGCIALVLLFVFLVARSFKVSLKAPDFYGHLLVVGIASQIGLQALVNVGVACSALPSTGIPLPFISYGGTSLVVFMGAMGIILNVSRYRRS